MVRTLNPHALRSLKKGQTAVLLPGSTRAEPWEAWILSASAAAQLVQVCSRPAASRLCRNGTLAFPASQVLCLPLWLNETDPKLLAGMIPLQLEARGLRSRGNVPLVFDWSVVAREQTRTLVVAGVLPVSLPEEMLVNVAAAFDLSVRYLPLAENSLTLWLEQDRLAVAFTRGPHLVYYQILGEGRISTRVLQDLHALRVSLALQGVVTSLQQVVYWGEIAPTEFRTLTNALQLPGKEEKRPAPRRPSSIWNLTPSSVIEARKARATRNWQVRAGVIALAVYLILVAVFLTRYFVTSFEVNQLRHWQTEHAQDIALVRETQEVWRDLQPVVDEDSYPLEMLLQAAKSIPPDQLHLTLFELSDGHLLIKGEARNVAAAFQFFKQLKADAYFSGYAWTMDKPNLLPNDLAQLQIEGTRATSN